VWTTGVPDDSLRFLEGYEYKPFKVIKYDETGHAVLVSSTGLVDAVMIPGYGVDSRRERVRFD
jgi:hypothetical protein